MNEFNLETLFPIPLMTFDYGKLNDVEKQFISKCLEDVYPNTYNLTSSDTYVLDNGLPDIREFIEKSIRTYVEAVIIGGTYDDLGFDFRITQSWLNKTLRNSNGHHFHNHPNSYISGVFYTQVNPNADSIYFSKSPTLQDVLKFPIKSHNMFNSTNLKYDVHEGLLVMFPSTLYHEVKPTHMNMLISEGDDEPFKDRISLSFNVFPIGNFGNSGDLNELRIQ
tara:strand:- start:489 stop:1154 length:666 start_codon:yes stop_codon:yes gene_type:complete